MGLLLLIGTIAISKTQKNPARTVCGLPKWLVHHNELAEAVMFVQAQSVFCVCGLFSRWLNCFTLTTNGGLIALSQPLNTKNILEYTVICPFPSCLQAPRRAQFRLCLCLGALLALSGLQIKKSTVGVPFF